MNETPAIRHGQQLGSMDAFLRTENGIQVVRTSRGGAVDKVALQIARNLCQYFGADVDVLDKTSSYSPEYSNTVRVALGDSVPDSYLKDFPLRVIHPGVVTLRGSDGLTKLYDSENGLCAIVVRPLRDDKVELLVWGADEEGLEIAARLVPMLTGVGQPDFVIADRRMLWGGAGNVLAMGFLDHMWNVTADSYLS